MDHLLDIQGCKRLNFGLYTSLRVHFLGDIHIFIVRFKERFKVLFRHYILLGLVCLTSRVSAGMHPTAIDRVSHWLQLIWYSCWFGPRCWLMSFLCLKSTSQLLLVISLRSCWAYSLLYRVALLFFLIEFLRSFFNELLKRLGIMSLRLEYLLIDLLLVSVA
jgi:hypothetical protein